MDEATKNHLAERIRERRKTRTTDLVGEPYRAPGSDCTSPERLAAEIDELFLGGPLVAGLSCDAPSPGDWFTFEALGRSVVVWRMKDGGLRAFLNACRHRGMRICSGTGHARQAIVCPYHRWAYKPTGEVHSVPQEEGFDGIDLSERRLTEVPVREEAGVVYVALTPGVSIGGDLLGGAEAELAPFRFVDWHSFESREHGFRSNWKLLVDSFMEAYHLHYLHDRTLRPLFHGESSLFDTFGRNGRLVGIRRSVDSMLEGDGSDVLEHTTVLWQLFPNAVLIHQQDHVELYQSLPDPKDPNHGRIRVTLYSPAKADSEKARKYWTKNLDLIDQVTSTEDFAACEAIQANCESGAAVDIVVGRNEPGVAHFRRMVDRALPASLPQREGAPCT